MNKYLVIGLLVACLQGLSVSTAQAQVNSSQAYDDGVRPDFKVERAPEDVAREATNWMRRELKLNADSARQVGKINLQYERAYHEQLKATPEKTDYTRALLMKIRKEQMDELKKVLTPEQWSIYLSKLKPAP